MWPPATYSSSPQAGADAVIQGDGFGFLLDADTVRRRYRLRITGPTYADLREQSAERFCLLRAPYACDFRFAWLARGRAPTSSTSYRPVCLPKRARLRLPHKVDFSQGGLSIKELRTPNG